MQKITKNELLKILKNSTNDSTYEIEMLDDNHAKLILFVTIKAKDNKSSMTTKQFQEFVIEFIQEQKEVNKRQQQTNMKQAEFNQFVIEFIKEQKEFNKMVMQRLDNIENDIKEIKIRLDKIESCPTIQKEINSK